MFYMFNQLLSKFESDRTNFIVSFYKKKKCFEKTVLKTNLLVQQTNSVHKHSQLGSQISEPISAWKVYFRSPPSEIYARSLQSKNKELKRQKKSIMSNNIIICHYYVQTHAYIFLTAFFFLSLESREKVQELERINEMLNRQNNGE